MIKSCEDILTIQKMPHPLPKDYVSKGISLPFEKAKTLSTLGGLLATALMVNIILNFHVGVLEQTWTEFKYQLSLLAISVYFLFK